MTFAKTFAVLVLGLAALEQAVANCNPTRDAAAVAAGAHSTSTHSTRSTRPRSTSTRCTPPVQPVH